MQNMQDGSNLQEFLTIRAVEIESFNPEKEAKNILPIIERRNRDTLLIARSLFVAQQFYAEISNEKRKLNLKYINAVDLPDGFRSFKEFCENAGIPKTSAYRFLEKFVPGTTPNEDRLLTPEEISAIRSEERREEFIRVGKLVSQYQMTGKYPDGWDSKCDHELDRRLLEDRMVKTDIPSPPQPPHQLEFDFDGYVEKLLDSASDLEAKMAIAEDLIRRIQRKLDQYLPPSAAKKKGKK